MPRDELYHFGIHGMKWGVRRYQNEDGTLTPEGREHYAKESSRQLNRTDKRIAKVKAYENEHRLKRNDYRSKYKKALKKNKESSANKFRNKMKTEESKMKEQSKERIRYEKQNQKLVDSLVKDNYDVKVKSIPRVSLTKGEIVTYSIIAAADTLFPFTAGLGTLYLASRSPIVKGSNYKVKDNRT